MLAWYQKCIRVSKREENALRLAGYNREHLQNLPNLPSIIYPIQGTPSVATYGCEK